MKRSPSDPPRKEKDSVVSIATRLKKDPAWRVRYGGNRVCPYCITPIPETEKKKPGVAKRIQAHLREDCPARKGRKKKPVSAETLKKKVTAWKLRDTVKSNLASKKTWQFFDSTGRWLCAFCGKPVNAQIRDPESGKVILTKEALSEISHHFETCERSRKGATLKETQLDKLQKNINRFILISLKYASDKKWSVRNASGKWLCPYCGTFPDEVTPGEKQPISEIYRHLSDCDTFLHKNEELPFEELDKIRETRDRIIRMQDFIKDKLASVPRWQVCDNFCRWKCPYCTDTLMDTFFGDSPEASQETVIKISEHLVRYCSSYRHGKEPELSVEDLNNGPATSIVGELEKMKEDSSLVLKDIQKAAGHQKHMLSRLPKIPGMDVGIKFKSLEEISGDFYDFFQYAEKKRIGFVVGDVSGHGIQAGMIMSMVRKAVHIHGKRNFSPKQDVEATYHDIFEDLPPSTFVTLSIP